MAAFFYCHTTMKVLSLLQPWASLVVMGKKKIETRSWKTAYRGEILVHASSGKKGSILAAGRPFKKYIPDFFSLPFGAILGKVILDDIVPIEMLQFSSTRLDGLTLEERAFGDYTKGRYAWLLIEPVELVTPIFVKGSLGLWEFKGELHE